MKCGMTGYRHAQSDFYDVEGFKKGRSSMLYPIELEEMGDVSGKSLLQLQCHFGMDTLSWARLGAKVTGIDFSDKAIELAYSLSKELDKDYLFTDYLPSCNFVSIGYMVRRDYGSSRREVTQSFTGKVKGKYCAILLKELSISFTVILYLLGLDAVKTISKEAGHMIVWQKLAAGGILLQ